MFQHNTTPSAVLRAAMIDGGKTETCGVFTSVYDFSEGTDAWQPSFEFFNLNFQNQTFLDNFRFIIKLIRISLLFLIQKSLFSLSKKVYFFLSKKVYFSYPKKYISLSKKVYFFIQKNIFPYPKKKHLMKTFTPQPIITCSTLSISCSIHYISYAKKNTVHLIYLQLTVILTVTFTQV